MTLRKCPSCHDLVGADSGVCPRCGVRFKAAIVRRIVTWSLATAMLLWLAGHLLLKIA